MLQPEFQPVLQNQDYPQFSTIHHFRASLRIRRTQIGSVVIGALLVALLWGIAFFLFHASLIGRTVFISILFISILFSIAIAALLGWIVVEWLSINLYFWVVNRAFRQSMKSCYPDAQPSTGNQNPEANLLILGLPGAGKTKELEKYLFLRNRTMIPVLIPMRYYDGFLSARIREDGLAVDNEKQPKTLLAYLSESNTLTLTTQEEGVIQRNENELVGIRYLRPYLQLFVEQGRMVLLCDGLNELSPQSLNTVCEELRPVMQAQQNRVIMSCRELDYQEQGLLQQFVHDGLAVREVVLPISRNEVGEFTKHYLATRPKSKKRQNTLSTPDEVIQRIETTSRCYDCTSPFILITLIETLENIQTEEQAQRINSRGRLLQESVTQLLDEVKIEDQTKQNVRLFLSAIACTARRNKQRNAIQLGRRDRALSQVDLARDISSWLDENMAEEDLYEADELPQVVNLLKLAVQAGLITMSRNGALSFKHELIAEYFTAEYLDAIYSKNKTAVPFWQDMFQDKDSVGAWSEPVALWAGLVDEPMQLASHLMGWAIRHAQINTARQETLITNNGKEEREPNILQYALLISLACVGVIWTPSAEQYISSTSLPENVKNVMRRYLHYKQTRIELGSLFKRCADEGGIEVYRALLPLLSSIEDDEEEDFEDFMLRLDSTIIPGLLFDYLIDVVGNSAYIQQVERIKHMLGQFGSTVIAYTQELSRDNNKDLRAAAMDIMGHIRDARIVEPLLAGLSDVEEIVYKASVEALIRVGPELTLFRLEPLLHSNTTQQSRSAQEQQVNGRVLSVLEGFLPHSAYSPEHYRHIIAAMIQFLASLSSPESQDKAKTILLNQAKLVITGDMEKQKNVIEQLLALLNTRDKRKALNIKSILQDVGTEATPYLMLYWQNSNLSEIARHRIVEVMGVVRDPQALSFLISLLGYDSEKVQKQLHDALFRYSPQSIDPLIKQILSTSPRMSDTVVKRAAAILKDIGKPCVMPICQVLLELRERGTLLLVEVLAKVSDANAIPALIKLLELVVPQSTYKPLAIYVMEVLGSSLDKRVVKPLVNVLDCTDDDVYQMAMKQLIALYETAKKKRGNGDE